MSTTSTIPAAIDALVNTLTASIGSITNVVDGPPLSWEAIELPTNAVSDSRFLFVGASPDSDTSADGAQDFNAAGAISRDETFNVYGTVYVCAGDGVMKTRRDDAFGIVASVENAIRSDPTLGGAVLYARVAGVSAVAQRQTEDGSDCTVTFTVACRSYLS